MGSYGSGNGIDVALINMLRIEVSSAVSRADQVTAAQLQEAMRTVKQLGIDGLVLQPCNNKLDYYGIFSRFVFS
jgi:hypothetical protein